MTTDKNDWLDLLQKRHVLQEGHFLLTSGRHSRQYLQCARLFQHPQDAERVGRALAVPFRDMGVDAVVGPAVGGIIAAHEVARALGCRAVFTERENGQMTLRRGFQLEQGERVVVVEDVVTTGGSVKEVLRVVESNGADVLGIASVVNRTGEEAPFQYPYHALLSLHIETYEPDTCPLCRAGARPPIKPGSRRQ